MIGHEADVSGVGGVGVEVIHERLHDHPTNPSLLIFRQDGNIHDFKEAAAVSDDASNANAFVAIERANCRNRV